MMTDNTSEQLGKEAIDLTGLVESFDQHNSQPNIIVSIDRIAFGLRLVNDRVIMRRLIQNSGGEDYPGQTSEIRRERLIRRAIESADQILMDGADGSVEELDYLTAAVAEKWATKVLGAAQAKLLRKDMELR